MMNKQTPITATGWVGLVSLIGLVANQLLDGDPQTNPDWNYVVPFFFTALATCFQRAKKATSEDVGAK